MVSLPASRRVSAACAILIAIAPIATAQAGLTDAIHRVADEWRTAGAVVVVDKTRFLTDGETAAIFVPAGAAAECTTLLLLGARGLGFHVGTGETSEDNSRQRVSSEAGAITLERCGTPLPHRLLVTSDSGRGALEMAVARSTKPLPHLHKILPERTEGSLGPVADPGALPPLPAPEKRADLAEARAKRDGAAILPRMTVKSGSDGAGAGEAALAPGCHLLTVFAIDARSGAARRRSKLDVDAELRDSSDDRLLARDRSDAPDARLWACVGEITRVAVSYIGSPPDAPVLLSHGSWSLQQHLPDIWGTETKARMAQVLLARHVVSLPDEPAILAQGGAGTTSVPLPLEPGACYLAVVALAQGMTRALGLRVHVGPRETTDSHGTDEAGAVAAFCSGDRSRASAQVDARGAPLLGWGMAVYRLQNRVWELP
jgi:hypothetical protein